MPGSSLLLIKEPLTQTQSSLPFARFLALSGAVLCLLLTLIIWSRVSAFQSMWPLPALYLLEVLAVSLVPASHFIYGSTSAPVLAWAASGILFGFSILGAWSVGFFYVPVALVFLLTGMYSDWKNQGSRLIPHLGVFLAAGVIQAGVMLAVIL